MRWTSMVVAAVAALSLGAAEFDLGNFIRSRYRAGEREIVLPDGEVRCRGMVELGREFRDLTIRGGRDTKLVCTNLSDLFFLNGCSNVTMRDFAVDYDPLPFTQGTVTAIDRGKRWSATGCMTAIPGWRNAIWCRIRNCSTAKAAR